MSNAHSTVLWVSNAIKFRLIERSHTAITTTHPRKFGQASLDRPTLASPKINTINP
jgi:hypothetical protein